MPPITPIVEGLELGASLAEEAAPRFVTNLVELLEKPVGRMVNGARWLIGNPKTGEQLETVVSSGVLKDEGRIESAAHRYSHLYTPDRQPVASVVHSFGPLTGDTDSLFRYGAPPAWKPYLNLEFMQIEQPFTGRGVREAVVGELRNHSAVLGFGGRVKLLADNDFGSIPAIPWYKAGFRPQPYLQLSGSRFDKLSNLLEQIVKTRMRLTPEEGRLFDGLPMYLPEK